MTAPHASDPDDHPSHSDQMRLRLAQTRLREAEDSDLASAGLADLVLTNTRLMAALDDALKLVLEAWPDENEWPTH